MSKKIMNKEKRNEERFYKLKAINEEKHYKLLEAITNEGLHIASIIRGMGYLYESFEPQISKLNIRAEISSIKHPKILLTLDSNITRECFKDTLLKVSEGMSYNMGVE